MCAFAQHVVEQYAARVADGEFGRNVDIASIAFTAPIATILLDGQSLRTTLEAHPTSLWIPTLLITLTSHAINACNDGAVPRWTLRCFFFGSHVFLWCNPVG